LGGFFGPADALFWAVKSGLFDDMEGPEYPILMGEEEIY